MRCTGHLATRLCVGIVLLAPSWAMAMSKANKDRENAAKKACLLGDVEKGAEILADLYVETNDPTYIYNQGRCFEQNGKNDRALLRFKEYERKAKGLSDADLAALRKKIDELQAASPTPEPGPPATSTTPIPPSGIPAQPGTATSPATDEHGSDPLGITRAGPPPDLEASPPVYKRWWFWTGVGVLVAGGVVTGVLLSQKSAPSSPPCEGLGTCVP
jgi:hypothetical protein